MQFSKLADADVRLRREEAETLEAKNRIHRRKDKFTGKSAYTISFIFHGAEWSVMQFYSHTKIVAIHYLSGEQLVNPSFLYRLPNQLMNIHSLPGLHYALFENLTATGYFLLLLPLMSPLWTLKSREPTSVTQKCHMMNYQQVLQMTARETTAFRIQ